MADRVIKINPDSHPVPPNAPGIPSIPAPTIVLAKFITPLAIDDPFFDSMLVSVSVP